MSIRKWTLEDKEVRDARRTFDAARARNRSLKGPSFKTYLNIFQTDMTYTDIGQRLGRSKQAIHHTYQQYFSFLGPWTERIARHRTLTAAIEQELSFRQRLEKACADPTFLYLQKEAGKRGLSIAPVVDYQGLEIRPGYTSVFRVGEGRFLRAHVRNKLFLPAPDTPQQYAAFQVSPSMLVGIHAYAMLADIPGMDPELYLVRASALCEVLNECRKDSWTFYIPVGDYKPRKRRRQLDLRKFKDAWWVFDL